MKEGKIGIVVVAHSDFADSIVNAAKSIITDASQIESVGIYPSKSVEESRLDIKNAIAKVDSNSGVLLLTDMFGGTPSNLCLSFLQPAAIEVVSGVNLPMLIKLLGVVQTKSFNEVAAFIQRYGQKNIVIASQVLKGHID